eukprot:TRINITY_DN4783_c0_g1_i1.p1 TRINITY_DN4783_c0_g1~~TRINITY_DN4783_c0_g1_i1.p1  ORF type:complete len:488 (+),score=170.92 TRINITY_DN4783_c0_g1_i1:154-1617(+)
MPLPSMEDVAAYRRTPPAHPVWKPAPAGRDAAATPSPLRPVSPSRSEPGSEEDSTEQLCALLKNFALLQNPTSTPAAPRTAHALSADLSLHHPSGSSASMLDYATDVGPTPFPTPIAFGGDSGGRGWGSPSPTKADAAPRVLFADPYSQLRSGVRTGAFGEALEPSDEGDYSNELEDAEDANITGVAKCLFEAQDAEAELPPLIPLEEAATAGSQGSHSQTDPEAGSHSSRSNSGGSQPGDYSQQAAQFNTPHHPAHPYPAHPLSAEHVAPLATPPRGFAAIHTPVRAMPPPVLHPAAHPHPHPHPHHPHAVLGSPGLDAPRVEHVGGFPVHGHHGCMHVMVEFKASRMVKFNCPPALAALPKGTFVVVVADRGEHIGKLRKDITPYPKQLLGGPPQDLGLVVRVASEAELQEMQRHKTLEEKALMICRQKVEEADVQMDLVYAEYQFDLKKITFYYRSEARQDFRDLIRDLFKVFRARIWMEKIRE